MERYFFTYDIECFPNFFSVIFKCLDTGKKFVFEISSRKNDIHNIIEFVKKIKRLIGFNSKHYDNILLMYLYREYNNLKELDAYFINISLKKISDSIIENEEHSEENRELRKKYGYNFHFLSIDLFLYWSKMLRLSKKLSLKSIAINIGWHKIQELPLKPNLDVPVDLMDEVLLYNENDVNVTEAIFNKMKSDVNLRFAAHKKYGFKLEEVVNWDGVKLGLEVLIKRYCDRTGKDYYEVKKLRTHRELMKISDIILPCVKFKKQENKHRVYKKKIEKGKPVLVNQFENFYSLYVYLNNLSVRETSEINCEVLYKGVIYDVKSGGLHSRHTPEVIKPDLSVYNFEDDDVASYYPTLGSKWKFIPEHLGEEFAEELESIRLERINLKAKGLGKSDEANLLKLSLNGGFFGNTNNEHTCMFDRKVTLSICINGQLLLLMLIEKLTDIGVKIDSANTDGISIIYDKTLQNQVRKIIKDWEKDSKCEMETVNYSTVIRNNINNYLAFHPEINGKTEKPKEKGMYLTNPPLDMSRDAIIIPIALRAFYEKGIPIEETILNHKNILDFCLAQKIDRKFSVFWKGELQQNLNRYYVSTEGGYIFKSEDKQKMLHLMKGWTVQIFNDYEEKEMKDYNIDYKYYLSEARKILENSNIIQGSLFQW